MEYLQFNGAFLGVVERERETLCLYVLVVLGIPRKQPFLVFGWGRDGGGREVEE